MEDSKSRGFGLSLGQKIIGFILVIQLIVMLGLAIFGMIVGGDDSLYSTVRGVWEKQAEHRLLTDDPPM